MRDVSVKICGFFAENVRNVLYRERVICYYYTIFCKERTTSGSRERRKMKKVSKNILSWGVTAFATLCGLAAFFVVFADAVGYSLLDVETGAFSGLQVALGATVNNVQFFEASVGIILAYLFPLIAACALIIGKGFKIVTYLAAAMMLTGGVLAFCIVSLLNGTYIGDPSLAAGAIASGVLSVAGGVIACGSTFLKG